MPSGIEIEIDEPGSGAVAARGRTVVVRATGSLRRGEVFLNAETLSIRLGARDVIAGLEYGIEGMRVGGRRRVRVPPRLAYGAGGVPGKIPPQALLTFDLELLEVRD